MIAAWPVLPALAADAANDTVEKVESLETVERVESKADATEPPRDPPDPGSMDDEEPKPEPDAPDNDTRESAVLATVTPSAPLPTLATPSTIKTIRPQIDESSGALRYTFPLTPPPGRNGLQPDLALTYNSQDRQDGSIVGFGWSLSIPSVERVNKTGSQNLYATNFFASSLDGELATASGAFYYAKVERGDLREYQPAGDSWIMYDKFGTLYTFGATAASRQDNPTDASQVYRWMLSEIRDRNDNFISFTYDKVGGQIYPASIIYTGQGSAPGVFEVTFARESRLDVRKDYRSAFLVQTSERIATITAKVNGNPVRIYDLDYTTGQDGTRSMLASIAESGIDESGNTVALPPTTFAYETQASRASGSLPSLIAPFHVTTPSSGVLVADVNGDGLPDLLKSLQYPPPNPLVQEAYLNTGSSWVADPSWLPPAFPFASFNGPEYSVQAIDVNGDGKVDLVRSLPWAREAWLNTGTGWALDGAYSNFAFSQDPWQVDQGARLVDVNGDDLPDWIQQNGGNTTLQLNTGNGWGSTQSNPAHFSIPYAVGATASGVIFADLNADGLVDILTGRAFEPNYAFVNTGTGWVPDAGFPSPTDFIDSGNGDEGIRMVDLNNDGLPDLARRSLYTNYGWLNTGVGWTGQYTNTWVPGGSCDFINGALQNATRFADLNGDGLMDWLCTMGTDPVPVTTAVINTGTHNDSLTSVETPLGGTSSFVYQATPMYLDASGARLNPALPYVIQTVRTITHDDGLGTISSQTFVYEGGSYYYTSATERKFVGFHSVEATDAAGFATTTWYHQGNGTDAALGEASDHVAKAGLPFRVEVRDAADNLARAVVNTWERVNLGACACSSFVTLASTVSLDFDGDVDHRDKAVSYTYDVSSGNVLQRVEWGEVSAGTDGSFMDAGSDARTTAWLYAYNGSLHILGLPKQETLTDQAGVMLAQTKSTYDGLPWGSVTFGNLTKDERWKSGASYVDVEHTYNAYGLMTQEIDPLNRITSYTPDAYNLYPSSVTNALSHTTAYLYDYSSGKPTQTTDPNGAIMQTVFDGLDRVIEEKQSSAASASVLQTRTTYAYAPQAVGMQTLKTDFLDSMISRVSYAYTDGFDRPIQSRVEAEAANSFAVTDTVYSNRESVWKQSLPYASSGSGRTTATTTPALLSTLSTDALGRTTNLATVVGNTSTAYDQWMASVTDPRGKVKGFVRDAFDRLVSVEEHDGASMYTTSYVYNVRGDLTGLTDTLGNVRAFTYDGLSRRLTAQDLHAPADTSFGTWVFAYDDAGNLTSTVNPKAQTVQYIYDSLNRPLTEDFMGAAGIEVTNVYDACVNGTGRLCSISKTGFSETRQYDELGRMSSQTRTIDGTPFTTSFTYDRQGNQLTIANPDGSQVQYVYNGAGLLEQVNRKESTTSWTPAVSNIDYAPTFKRSVMQYANGTTSTDTYDANELYRLRTKITSTPSGNQQHLTYTYDANGNVTQIVDASSTLSAKTTAYTYDDLNRLISATVTGAADGQNGTQSYTYNAIGNILTRSDVGSYSYAGNTGANYANPHAATAAGGTTFTYDQNGNLATSAVTSMMPATPSVTPAWYPSSTGSWSHRLPLTIQQFYISGTTALLNFPVLVSHTLTTLRSTANGGNVAQVNGNDLLFTASDGVTKLDHEIEKYNPVTGELVAWVRVPSLSATVNTEIYLYAGNTLAANQQNPTGVWSSELKGVWHLDEDPTLSGAPITDSTSNAFNGMPYGSMPASASSTAKIGQGLAFDGSNDYVDAGAAASINTLTNNFTVSAWIYPTSLSGVRRFLSAGKTLSNNGFGVGTSGTYPRLTTYGVKSYTRASPISLNAWTKVDMAMVNNNVKFYRNGIYVGQVTHSTGGIANPDDTLRLGATTAVGSSTLIELFKGTLDEVRVCQCVRNGTWLQAEYNTQNAPTSFVTTGVMQAAPTPVMTPVTVTTTYAWDYGNRLLSIASSSLAASFLYDAEGTRMKFILGGVTTKTPTTWYNVSGTMPTKHILTPDGEMLATVEGSNAAATVSYIHTDHLTGSSLITNNTGAQTQLLDYHPFGTLRLNNQSSTFNEKRKFAGHEYDTETSLSYMGARYYDPATGRFLSEDPAFLDLTDPSIVTRTGLDIQRLLADPQGLNAYSYSRNNPVIVRDPTGEWWQYVAAAGVGAAISGSISWALGGSSQDIAGAALGGAVAGSVALIASRQVGAMASAALSGVAAGMATRAVTGQPVLDLGSIGQDAIGSIAAGAAGRVIGSISRSMGVGGVSQIRPSDPGAFSIIGWDGYPQVLPRPEGPFKLLGGDAYTSSREVANQMNRNLRAANPAAYFGLDLHEIQPVKFGGDPASLSNKIAIPRDVHGQVTSWWNALQRSLKK